MRYAAAALAAVALVASPADARKHAAATPSPEPTVEPELRCPTIRIALDAPVSSASARDGEVFRFTNVDAVILNGKIALDAQTGDGIGVVSYVEHAQRGGRSGVLVLDPRYLVARGREIHVVIDRENRSGFAVGKSGDVPAVLGFVPGARFVLGAYSAVHHGTDVTVPAGTIFTVYVGDEREIDRCLGGADRTRPRRQS